jgi:SAM-dependent methyltransferase
MVHALEEIRRVLLPGGDLIDLRPLADRWPVEIAYSRTYREVGRLTDMPTGLADDAAAERAIAEAAQRGWFVRESELTFPFFYYWDTPREMKEYTQEKWTDFLQLEKDTYSAAQSMWAAAGPGSRVRVRMKLRLSRWRKP